ncbi:MAG: CRISPR-associated ring nuclease Csm6 [Candidatus Binatia bacterium]
MASPHRYRNIFLFVGGLTPQIITETLFFYLVKHRPAIHPSEVHVLTTSEGKHLLLDQLLDPQSGRFYRFCHEYCVNTRSLTFSPETVEVPRDQKGRPLSDIRTDTDNRAAADQVVAKVRALTRDPQIRLYASLAGGRKTMGLYLGFALQFYGRPHDRLIHVLISPADLEGNEEFFYPPRNPRASILTASGRVRAGEISVAVAEAPFILLGHKLPVLQGHSDLSYGDLVARSQHDMDLLSSPRPLRIDPASRSLRVGDITVRLSGLELAVYLFVARKKKAASCLSTCPGCSACGLQTADFIQPETIQELEDIAEGAGLRDRRLQQLSWWFKEEEEGKKRFLQVCARLKRKIHSVLGDGSMPYLITPLRAGRGRLARYTISLQRDLISLGPVRI